MSWFRKKHKYITPTGYSALSGAYDKKMEAIKWELCKIDIKNEKIERRKVSPEFKTFTALLIDLEWLHYDIVRLLLKKKITKRKAVKILYKIEEERRKLNDQRT